MPRAEPHTITVLLIEDEPLIRMGTSAMLEDAGYNVLEAGDAGEALEMLQQHPEIDIVVTDVQMPGGIDGLGLIEIIRRDYSHLQALVTSGRASIAQARQCGAAKFLSKPYTAMDIQTAVRAVLENQSAQ